MIQNAKMFDNMRQGLLPLKQYYTEGVRKTTWQDCIQFRPLICNIALKQGSGDPPKVGEFHVMFLVGDFQKIRCGARRYPLRGSKIGLESKVAGNRLEIM